MDRRPILGFVIVALLGLANKRFGVLGGLPPDGLGGVAFVGARLLRGRRALLTGERIDWRPSRPNRSHVFGSALFGIGWGISDACPGPTAAQLGAGRVLALAVAAGILVGVRLQPSLAAAVERSRASDTVIPTIGAADVL